MCALRYVVVVVVLIVVAVVIVIVVAIALSTHCVEKAHTIFGSCPVLKFEM